MLPLIKRRLIAIRHKGYIRAFSRIAPYYLVNEYPKSGGTWLALMLADALDLPFRRNEPIRFEPSITHGHFLSPLNLANMVVIWRDPRDLLSSFYYHSYFVNEHDNSDHVKLMKAKCPFSNYRDIRKNMPDFIRFVTESPVSPSFSWPYFAIKWHNRSDAAHTSYEAMRADTAGELKRIIGLLIGKKYSDEQINTIVDRHSFDRAREEARQKHTNHTEMSFIREGALGGWKKNFTTEATDILRKFGYEKPMSALGYTLD